jgi:hypothetical protein
MPYTLPLTSVATHVIAGAELDADAQWYSVGLPGAGEDVDLVQTTSGDYDLADATRVAAIEVANDGNQDVWVSLLDAQPAAPDSASGCHRVVGGAAFQLPPYGTGKGVAPVCHIYGHASTPLVRITVLLALS